MLHPTDFAQASRPVFGRWWREPRVTWWAVASAAVLLFLRKPWSLTTPQLWAEDGPIHLADIDSWGAHAFFVPYRGYLHLLPRLIAWVASHVADVAQWPLIYNVAAFLVAVALLARLASKRFDLPAKPWLVLSFVLAAHTGEVWFNITNLHWLTSFFLVQQVLIARPVTRVQRFGDLAILAVIGLTGPFVVVLLPLLAWRWWRDRHADNLAVLLTAAACAAVQIYFLGTTSLPLDVQSQPLNPGMLFAVTGSRLVVWPLFGQAVAETLPWPALSAIGLTFIAVLLGWTLRPNPRRLLRAQIVVAFVTMTAVCLWRVRPDTWAYPDLVNGDSYFYVPRLLLLWLLIWEFDARPRPVAIAARTLCLIGIATGLPHFSQPAPPDYNWAEYSETIRRGDPAMIPTLPEGFVFDYVGRPRGAKPRATAVVPLAAMPSTAGRLINVSVRTGLTADDPTLTVGAVIGGAGTSGVKPLFIRAVGPSLASLGITDGLPDPELVVMNGPLHVAANDNWAGDGAAALSAAFASVGAFALMAETSRDAAVAFNPTITSTTSYTVEVRGRGTTGTVLAELYDATPNHAYTRTTPRLINFSVLKHISAGDVLAAGFFIGGTTPQKLLVRAIGPTLGTAFGLTGTSTDPKIDLFDGHRVLVASNNDWSGSEQLATTFRNVGAFQLPTDSRDAALVITLKPGAYSAHVSGNAGRGGVTLVEVYEVP